MSKKTGKYVNCEVCGKEVYRSGAEINKAKHFYCCKKCTDEGQIRAYIKKLKDKIQCDDLGKWLREQYEVNKRSTTSIRKELGIWEHAMLKLLKRFSIDTRSLSESVKLDWKGNTEKKKLVSDNAKKNIGHNSKGRAKLHEIIKTKEYRYKQSISKKGSRNGMYGKFGQLNPHYNPNLSLADRIVRRHLKGYTAWRNKVYSRDEYTCQCCGDNKGGTLNAHHLKSYNLCTIDERIDINNGITLCDKCHKLFHETYGYGNNTKEQYIKFKNKRLYKPNIKAEQIALTL